jgi:uncharacterized ion transporter superfamily protein YfcC
VLLAAALSYVVPAGAYDRRDDPATGRAVVVPGSFHRVPAAPVGPFRAVVGIPKGIADAAAVVALIFLVGGAFAVVERTGALAWGVHRLVDAVGGRPLVVIPIVSLAFAAGGALENMQEEIIAFVPVLVVLAGRLGLEPLTAAAMSVGAAAVGSAFSPVNPFQVGIAQKLAELPLFSGWAYRTALLAAALALWIAFTVRHARRTRRPPAAEEPDGAPPEQGRAGIVLGLVVAAFALLVLGIARFGWGFDELSALFLVMGVVAGFVAGLGLAGTADAFAEGFRAMAPAALLVGFARAISVVLADGRILDTIVHAAVTPIAGLPVALSATAMIGAHLVIHVPVPSVSGQAALTLPILVPVADLIGLSRQVTVLAYQTGAGLCELVTPTNGALMAILAAAGVRFEGWLRFALPATAALVLLGAAAVWLGVAVGY